MFKFDDIISYRHTKIFDLYEQGFSDSDIARFFEVTPKRINKLLSSRGIKRNNSNKHEEIEKLIIERDKLLSIFDDSDYVGMSRYGFYYKPNNYSVCNSITEAYIPEFEDDEYRMVFDGVELWKVRNALGYKSTKALNDAFVSRRLVAYDIMLRGKNFRDFSNMGKILELYRNGFSQKEILNYYNEYNIYYIKKCYSYGVNSNIITNQREQRLLELFTKGYKLKDISEYVGISYRVSNDINKINSNEKTNIGKVGCKNRNLREKVFELYFIDNIPMKKITEDLNVTRRTVYNYINAYVQEHPDKIALVRDKRRKIYASDCSDTSPS